MHETVIFDSTQSSHTHLQIEHSRKYLYFEQHTGNEICFEVIF